MKEVDPSFWIMLHVKELSLLSWNVHILALEFITANMMMMWELNACVCSAVLIVHSEIAIILYMHL